MLADWRVYLDTIFSLVSAERERRLSRAKEKKISHGSTMILEQSLSLKMLLRR